MVAGKDLTKLDESELFQLARQAAAKGDYNNAVAFQFWVVRKSNEHRYDLACYYARTGKADAAFYWLQKAALEDGVDAGHAGQDEDLETLRRDARWNRVADFLAACNGYWQTSGLRRQVLILPKGYDRAKPIAVVVGLHGLGSNEQFINDSYQPFADQLGMAFLGVSGTVPAGPRSFVWSEDPVRDDRRVKEALEAVADRLTVKRGHVVLIGFSQGAQASVEIAVRDPATYAGAIVMSPGFRGATKLAQVKPVPALTRSGFVLLCNAGEHPGNVKLTAADAQWVRNAKARVLHRTYPNIAEHTYPPDFRQKLPSWIRFIDQARGK